MFMIQPPYPPSTDLEPAYLQVYRSGELRRRVEAAVAQLAHCRLCPRACGVDRTAGELGTCGIGRYAHVAGYFPHHGEEGPLRGWRGSGTIFFAQCNLRCVFCQNYEISQAGEYLETPPGALAGMMLDLQNRGCHNINLVTPSHVVPQILEALTAAVGAGLRLPLVYNSSGYDSVETLRLLDGVVDIYMPDFKIWDEALAEKYLRARDYPATARAALREMHRQVGELTLDANGVARRGLLVRYLVLPGERAGTLPVAEFLARELSTDTYVNVMAQYHPAGEVHADRFAELDRRITQGEYDQALRAMSAQGLNRFE